MTTLDSPSPAPFAEKNLLASIVACLGEDIAKYAANKHRGGENGKKGSRYEDYFLAYKVAEIVFARIGNHDLDWPVLAGQTRGFVDDIVVQENTKTEYFQLKNVEAITWTGGKHPVATDFSYQYKLACYEGQPNPMTSIVVPHRRLEEDLLGTIPGDIQMHSGVVLFPFSVTPNRLVLENESLHPVLSGLARSRAPEQDELVGVLGVLIIACLNHPEGGSVDEILRSAHRYTPNQLRSSGVLEPVVLRVRFGEILAEIEGLTYDVSQGFFTWAGLGTTGGFDFDCADIRFSQFQELIERECPTTFDGFEELLP